MPMETQQLGLMHFWQAGDAVTHAVAYLLLAMSVVSWYFILSKAWSTWRLRRGARAALEQFWNARSMDEALATLERADAERVFLPLVQKARAAAAMQPDSSLAASIDRDELITREMRGEITQASARLESGLAFLASVGSTAPFVGLFGTVWGIHHALLAIGTSGSAALDQVAGPVGEALIMTGIGLAVAIPAAAAYNAFARVRRNLRNDLESFAADLFDLLGTGATATSPLAAGQVGQQSRLAPGAGAAAATGS